MVQVAEGNSSVERYDQLVVLEKSLRRKLKELRNRGASSPAEVEQNERKEEDIKDQLQKIEAEKEKARRKMEREE